MYKRTMPLTKELTGNTVEGKSKRKKGLEWSFLPFTPNTIGEGPGFDEAFPHIVFGQSRNMIQIYRFCQLPHIFTFASGVIVACPIKCVSDTLKPIL